DRRACGRSQRRRSRWPSRSHPHASQRRDDGYSGRAQYGPGDERRRSHHGYGLRPTLVRRCSGRSAEKSGRDCCLSWRGVAVTTLLEIKELELAYGQVAVCRDISLRLDRGEIVALIGANGAGKSTTLRAIAGLLPPRGGTITFSGKDVTAMPSYERSKLGIA